MNIILIVKDKTGREIILRKDRWSHILKHPEMANQQERIKENVPNTALSIIDFSDDKNPIIELLNCDKHLKEA